MHGVDANFVAREIFKSEGVLRFFGQGSATYFVIFSYVTLLIEEGTSNICLGFAGCPLVMESHGI